MERKYISSIPVPKWVRNLDKSNCEVGKVYNIYKCKDCMIEHSYDILRKGRKYSKSRNGKVKSGIQCACWQKSGFLMKYKKCAFCGKENYGIRLSRGKCPNCTNKSEYKSTKIQYVETEIIVKPKEYYRLNKPVLSKVSLVDENKWDCIKRNECLEITRIPGNARVMLGCKDCPYYVKGTI